MSLTPNDFAKYQTRGHDVEDWALKAAAASIATVEHAQMVLDAWRFVQRMMPTWRSDQLKMAYELLNLAVHAEVGAAQERVLTWGVVDPRVREEARKLAMKKFINDQHHSSFMFSEDGDLPRFLGPENQVLYQQVVGIIEAEKEAERFLDWHTDLFDRWALTSKANLMHLFEPGPGQGDAALCGAILKGTGWESSYESDRICTKCTAAARKVYTTDHDEEEEANED